MSNLLTNGNFASLALSTNNYTYYPSLTTTQTTNLYWTTTSRTQIALINGNRAFGYPSLSGQSFTQYMSFQSTAEMEQTVNILTRGNLTLSFHTVIEQSQPSRPTVSNYSFRDNC